LVIVLQLYQKGRLKTFFAPSGRMFRAKIMIISLPPHGEIFECHPDEQGLIAKKVQLSHQRKTNGQNNGKKSTKAFHFGVMT
jgi:hypothetical protein